MIEVINKKIIGGFRLSDLLVIALFLFTAALSINMFRIDLMQTINLRNVEPVGNVVIRKNVVQRRLSDRVLWDRLASESPVYLGDLIRVADLSSATLFIDGSSIDLSENTLIRLTRAADGEGLQIIMSEGNLSLAATPSSGRISLEVNGRQVQTVAGSQAVINVTAEDNGMTLQVSEGNVQVMQSGQPDQTQTTGARAIGVSAGGKVSLDTRGAVREVKSASVTSPSPNARFINGGIHPLAVNFSWNRINLNDNELLRLEISPNRNFRQISHVQENLNNQTEIALNNGNWYWRLSYQNTVYDQGRLTISDGAGTKLQSPAVSSVFSYTARTPVIRFKWDDVSDASSYIVEVSGTQDFTDTRIKRQSYVSFFTDSTLEEGTWYWRVMPVFPQVFAGNASYSQVSHFLVEKRTPPPVTGTQTTGDAAATVIDTIKVSLSEWLAAEVPPELVRKPVVVIPTLSLNAPTRGTRIDGLTALHQQTFFTWDCDVDIASSRFVLSSNTNPLRGRPLIEIQNPGRSVTVNSLNVGTWYWNIEAKTENGETVTAAEHGVLHVTAVPLLPAAQNLQPARGRRITMNDLQVDRSINFSWQAVRGANTYILTIYQQTGNSRRRVFQTPNLRRTNFSFNDLSILDRGNFIWQVEAQSRTADGVIEQRGTVAESTFIMDIFLPGRVQIDGTGVSNE